MKYIALRLWLLLPTAVLPSLERAEAVPNFDKTCLTELFSLRDCFATVNATAESEFDVRFKRKSPKRFSEVKPGSLVSGVEIHLRRKLKELPLSQESKVALRDWFERSSWVEQPDLPLGLAPSEVLVWEDDKVNSGVWMLSLYDGIGVLQTGRACGKDAYQVLHDSKAAILDDAKLVKQLADLVSK
jgi:hypothetical protein